ncbi:hypothetical protein E4U21_003096 [Claviceps maximensis]|nr:hypothetical protein E4U21_003096 [Claviceps maximensis]
MNFATGALQLKLYIIPLVVWNDRVLFNNIAGSQWDEDCLRMLNTEYRAGDDVLEKTATLVKNATGFDVNANAYTWKFNDLDPYTGYCYVFCEPRESAQTFHPGPCSFPGSELRNAFADELEKSAAVLLSSATQHKAISARMDSIQATYRGDKLDDEIRAAYLEIAPIDEAIWQDISKIAHSLRRYLTKARPHFASIGWKWKPVDELEHPMGSASEHVLFGLW